MGVREGGGADELVGCLELGGQPATPTPSRRYIKDLPVPRGTTARAKLEAYLAAEIGDL